MSAVYPTLPKLAVRDGFDEDDLTDIDDEVFIRDGKNGSLKIDDDGGVKRPLMAPRRKCKKSCKFEAQKIPYRALFIPLCYGVMALLVLFGLVILCMFTVNIFPMPLSILKNWLSHELKEAINESYIVPCTSLATTVLWVRTLPKLTSESPLRSNDVNGDGVEDIILGFSTGLDTMDTPEYICALYFEGQVPCLGGVLALNGKTGDTLWTHWTAHAIFSVDCGLDITNDKTKDCVISGRGGILHAINGRDGSSIWEIPVQDLSTVEEQRMLDVYDAKFITDTDGDGIGDVIASHSVQSDEVRSSEILIISGVSGNIMRSVNLPDTEQLFLAPQTLVHPDGERIFVLVTSSQKQSGGLYIVPQVNLMYGDLKLRKLHHDTGKGALLPPILVDITSDGVEDIVAAMFNSTIMAYDGLTFEPIWNYTISNSEVISTPIPGYYNDDNVPDFMVKHQIGSGFPTYYYTVATIIDGKTGKSLLENPIEDSLSRQMSGLSVTVEDYGNDWFLHWSVDCLNYEGVKEKYQFLKGENLMSETRADLCKLRFNSTLTTNLFALSQHVGPPGISLYFSEDWKAVEFDNSLKSEINPILDVSFVSEKSPKSQKDHDKENTFRRDSEDTYNYGDYKGRKKVSLTDSPNDNSADANYNWKDGNKWSPNNVQTNKDYDITYDGDRNVNTDDEQNVDYLQTDEVREQRRDINNKIVKLKYNGIHNSPNETNSNNRSDVVSKENIPVQINDYTENTDVESDKTIDTPITMKRKREIKYPQKGIGDAYNATEESTMIESLIDTIRTPSEDDVFNSSNIEPFDRKEYNLNSAEFKETYPEHIESRDNDTDFEPIFSSVTLLYNATNISISIENDNNIQGSTDNEVILNNITDGVQEIEERARIYLHNFPSIIQNREEDANIEKIFKRESLKNRNGQKVKIRRHRKKREADVDSEHRNRIYGIQKQPPTGILLPSILESKGKTSVDLVFSTFWLPSSEISVILLQEDLDCIHRKKALLENKLQYKENDLIRECLSERGINYKIYQEAMDRENFKIAFGQMAVYRMKLECVCSEDMLPNQSCKNISSHQSWPEHLGSLGNGYFRPLHKLND